MTLVNDAMDLTYHYPADLMPLLIDTIPLLCRSKKDVLQFLRGAGVAPSFTTDIAAQLDEAPVQVKKHHIVRTVLTRLNEKGEAALGERREVLRRVIEFEDFSSCWPDDRLKAQGLVSQIQKLVNVKDSFTRMKQERDEERRRHQEKVEREVKELQRRETELEDIKTDFFRLFSETNAWKRGKALEAVINRIFKAHNVLVREAFVLRGDEGQGVVEQIDGVIEFDGDLYLVEMKWWGEPLGPGDVAQHMVRVFNRSHARGVFIGHPGFTEAALKTCQDALRQSVFVLCHLEEFVRVMTDRVDLKAVLKAKVRAAIVDRTPLFRGW